MREIANVGPPSHGYVSKTAFLPRVFKVANINQHGSKTPLKPLSSQALILSSKSLVHPLNHHDGSR
ncbi:hypothetical protein P692DRAFT_20839790, partial [Suillus brevipes Sb2]